MTLEDESLDALSPLDGRYVDVTAPLRPHFSERAFLRLRVVVEVEYLIALAQVAHLARPLSESEELLLRSLASDSDDSARRIKTIERDTRHDVKAIEYYMRERLASTSLANVVEWLHFGLTSEDVSQTALALALRDSRDGVLLHALDVLLERLVNLARRYKQTPMLARTHGQPAVPTTLGKEFAAFVARLGVQRTKLANHRFEAKIAGAVGNWNALHAAAPQVDWIGFSAQFLRSLGLEPNLVATQLLPYDNWLEYFDALRLANSILLDLSQDIWRYISDDYLTLAVVAGEVGSSTMPQKVNPIDFENAEGNLGIANALFVHYAQKLPISRLQRDLSDSTVRRTFGVALGHTLVAWTSLAAGLDRIQANEPRLRQDLENHWDAVAEGAQTILRAAGIPDAYEQLKELTRGKQMNKQEYEGWVARLNVSEDVRARLIALTPFTYVGLAAQIVDLILA